MSSPHLPGNNPNLPPPLPPPPANVAPAPPAPPQLPNPYNLAPAPQRLGPNNPWPAGHVTTPDVARPAHYRFNAMGGHDVRGATIARSRAIQRQEKIDYRYRQPAHENITGLPFATYVADLGRIAFRGRRIEGQPVGRVARIAAGVGAVALAPLAAVNAVLRAPFRAATNYNRGHEKLSKRVVPRRGEAPHAVRAGYNDDPHVQREQAARAAQAAQAPTPPPAPRQPRRARRGGSGAAQPGRPQQVRRRR